MARTDTTGQSLEFTAATKRLAYQRNYDTPPRGCVGYWCEWCFFSKMKNEINMAGRMTAAFQVDHLIPIARCEEFGISIDQLRSIDNAVILCAGCNGSKSLYDYPRFGAGLAYRVPNENMTHGTRRQVALDWDDLVQMAMRKGRFRTRG